MEETQESSIGFTHEDASVLKALAPELRTLVATLESFVKLTPALQECIQHTGEATEGIFSGRLSFMKTRVDDLCKSLTEEIRKSEIEREENAKRMDRLEALFESKVDEIRSAFLELKRGGEGGEAN